jgi:hypothetical protein
MTQKYIGRTLEPVLRRAARDFPAVVLTGPRQSSKPESHRQASRVPWPGVYWS